MWQWIVNIGITLTALVVGILMLRIFYDLFRAAGEYIRSGQKPLGEHLLVLAVAVMALGVIAGSLWLLLR